MSPAVFLVLIGAASGVQTRLQTELLERLASPAQPVFLQCEREGHWFAFTDDEAERCLEYMRSNLVVCWDPLDEEERAWVELQRPLYDASYVPAAVQRMRSEEATNRKSETFVLGPDSWWALVDETSVQGNAIARHSILEPSAYTRWSFIDGVPGRTYRSAPGGPCSQGAGLAGNLCILRGEVRAVLEIAAEQGHLQDTGAKLTAVAELRRPALHERFPLPFGTANGFFTTPGEARLTFGGTESGGRVLELLWVDCDGEPLHRKRLEWGRAGDVFARKFVTEDLAPGIDRVISRATVTIASRPAEPDEIERMEWRPTPGEVVQDERFGAAVVYEVAGDGSVPSDGEIAAEAEALLQEWGAEPGPQVVSFPADPAERALPERGPPPVSTPGGPRPWLPWCVAAATSMVLVSWLLLRARRSA